MLHLFWGEGCPHCAAEREFLAELEDEFPELEVRQYEVMRDEQNRARFVEMAAERGVDARAVPTTFLGERVWVGFGDPVAEELRAAVAAAVAGGDPADVGDPGEATGRTIDVPFAGDVDVEHHSLLVSTVLIGFVDGFNPCSLWVLSVLLALVLHTGSRGRVFAVGAVFLVVTTALYGLYIAGLYSVLSYIAYLDWIRVAVALVALVFGAINVKDYFWFGRGVSFTIPEERKPGIYRRMRAITTERSLAAVLGATVALAVGVSLVETPCTAGFPILWADLLAEQGVAFPAAAGLFGVYMLVFLVDELVIFAVAVVALRAARLQERHGRLLKLVGGMVMLTLAGVLVFAPGLMESVSGALAVFALAGLGTSIVVLLDRVLGADLGAKRAERPIARQELPEDDQRSG